MIKPEHVAIVPDGNRRWTEKHGLPKFRGHQAGAERMHQIVDALLQLEIRYLTIWGFSLDNWKRTDDEIQNIFNLLGLWVEKDTPWLHEKCVRLKYIGRLDELPPDLQCVINNAIELTQDNQGMTLILAFNYTGRVEIVDAARRLIKDKVPWHEVDENLFSHHLYTDGMPDVDLVIRTADEIRLSNFMLWQTAYSEYYFTEVLWPDFDEKELEKALEVYSERQRRFGGD
ncbi:Isoprenyl transferase [subsurface metagenome]